jgi:hypothetical protein
MHDNDWMKGAAAHFRRLVEQAESEANRSSQIAAAVRAERE